MMRSLRYSMFSTDEKLLKVFTYLSLLQLVSKLTRVRVIVVQLTVHQGQLIPQLAHLVPKLGLRLISRPTGGLQISVNVL